MPLKLKRRTHKYDVSMKNALMVVVELLDQRVIECCVGLESLAQECLDIVLNRLQVKNETRYFGLQYLNKQKHSYWWLELDKPLKKQLCRGSTGAVNYVVRFGVMYYVPNISKIQDQLTRHLYFLQIKKLITEGVLVCSSVETICKLGSYALQAEFGDYNRDVHNINFLQLCSIFPTKYYGNAPEELFEKVLKLYEQKQGISTEQSQVLYLIEAQQIEDYSVEYIEAKRQQGRNKEEVFLGVSNKGLIVQLKYPEESIVENSNSPCKFSDINGANSSSSGGVENNKQLTSWSRIVQITYKDASSAVFSVVCVDKSEMKFIVDSNDECRYFWVRSIGYHRIFQESRKMSVGTSGHLFDMSHQHVLTVQDSNQHASNQQLSSLDDNKLLKSGHAMPNNLSHQTSSFLINVKRGDRRLSHETSMSNKNEISKGRFSTHVPPSIESPFSLKFSYPLLEDEVDYSTGGGVVKNQRQSSDLKRGDNNSTFLSDSGGSYAQLSFRTSSSKPNSPAAATVDVNSNNEGSAVNSNTQTSHLPPKRPLPSYEFVMANQLPQQEYESNHRKASSSQLSQQQQHQTTQPFHYSSHPNISNIDSGGSVNIFTNNAAADAHKYISVDANRYDYFENLSAAAAVTGDDAAVINGQRNCVTCGAFSILPSTFYVGGGGGGPTHAHRHNRAAINRNTSLSFSKTRDEEHSVSLSPHESPLNHAVSSPELNYCGTCHSSNSYINQHQCLYPNNNGQYSQSAASHYVSPPSHLNHPNLLLHHPPPHLMMDQQQPNVMRRPSSNHHHVLMSSNQPIPNYYVTSPNTQQPTRQYRPNSQAAFTGSSPALFHHTNSYSNIDQCVSTQHVNNHTVSPHKSHPPHSFQYRKASDPLPRQYIHQAFQGDNSFNNREEFGQQYDVSSFEETSRSPHLRVQSNFIEDQTKNNISKMNNHTLPYSPKANYIQNNNYQSPVANRLKASHDAAEINQSQNISTWSISPLSKFKSSDKLDKLDDDDAEDYHSARDYNTVENDESHPYSDPERAELRRNNPTAFQGDLRRSYMERKLIENTLKQEYDAIPLMKKSGKFTIAKATENYYRNRFSESLPYDDTIVKLAPCRELNNPFGFINASWIKTKIAGTTFRYIATQNPLEGTCADFWQMVWEKQATLIIMFAPAESGYLNNNKSTNYNHLDGGSAEHARDLNSEERKSKMVSKLCAKYRPMKKGEVVEYGYVSVTAVSVQSTEYCFATTLKLCNQNEMESRVVWHLHFTGLPILLPSTHPNQIMPSVSPRLVASFIKFLNEVRSIRQHLREEGMQSLPIIVHCATGNGASGAFVLSEIMLTLIEHEEVIDVERVLTFLRYQRSHMVDNYFYYEIVYRTIIQSLALLRLI